MTDFQNRVYSADDPIWIDDVWVDTVVVVGLTCFILCLMGLSKVRQAVLNTNTVPYDRTYDRPSSRSFGANEKKLYSLLPCWLWNYSC